MPGSSRQFTQAEIEANYAPPVWFPEDTPNMPSIVEFGRPPDGPWACSKCHVANGAGHPESSDLAGLSKDYILAQLALFKVGHRKGSRAALMAPIARTQLLTAAEAESAAAYFSALKPQRVVTVIEREMVPQSVYLVGGMRFASDDGSTEAIGSRVLEFPDEPARMKLRDGRSGFHAFAPPGSIARGKALARGESDRTTACSTCHGGALMGEGPAPRIAARYPQYVFRQLNDFKAGQRKGTGHEQMAAVVANLSQADMVDLAAYLGSLDP